MSQSGMLNIAGGGGGGSPILTLTGNSGGPVPPTANNINTLGTGSITTVGNAGTSTLTAQLTGLTNNAIQVGAGTATLTQLGPTNRAVLTTTAGGVPQLLALTDGQIIIGSTAGAPAAGTLTSGTGISIVNGSNAITINSTGGLTWTAISANQTLSVNNGYICVSPGGALSLALPAVAAVGSEIEVTLDGATSWTVTQGAGQQIRLGNVQTTSGAGGSLASTAQGNTIRMVCSVANNKWNILSSIGNITVV